jgi:hypothetical protein
MKSRRRSLRRLGSRHHQSFNSQNISRQNQVRLFIILSVFLTLLQIRQGEEPRLARIGPGQARHFSIDMIMPSPMSDPHNVATQFNWPDTLDLLLSVTGSEGGTLIAKAYPSLAPGLYQFSWTYGEVNKLVNAHLNMTAVNKRKVTRFIFALGFTMV